MHKFYYKLYIIVIKCELSTQCRQWLELKAFMQKKICLRKKSSQVVRKDGSKIKGGSQNYYSIIVMFVT